jgi:hypothetical protein
MAGDPTLRSQILGGLDACIGRNGYGPRAPARRPGLTAILRRKDP